VCRVQQEFKDAKERKVLVVQLVHKEHLEQMDLVEHRVCKAYRDEKAIKVFKALLVLKEILAQVYKVLRVLKAVLAHRAHKDL
jgi:hypothetical protein